MGESALRLWRRCARCLSFAVAKGMAASAARELANSIKAKLSETHAGAKLGAGLVDIVVKYLVEEVEIKDVNEVVLKDLLSTAKEAWSDAKDGSELPAVHVKAISIWLLRAGSGEDSAPGLIPSKDEDDEDESVLFGSGEPTARELAKLNDDKAAQRLSGLRLLRLSLALELGRVPAMGEVAGKVCYGSDPRISDMVKAQRKAGIPTMGKILESGEHVRRELNLHLACVQREFSESGEVVEATLVAQWWSESQAVSMEDKILAAYIKEYLRKFPCRGLPTPVDVLIATRVTGSREAAGATVESVSKVRDSVSSLKSELAEAKRLIANLTSTVGQLKSNQGNRNGGGGGGGGSEIICHKCGEKGHIARNCPNAKKIAEAKKAAAEADDEDKDE